MNNQSIIKPQKLIFGSGVSKSQISHNDQIKNRYSFKEASNTPSKNNIPAFNSK